MKSTRHKNAGKSMTISMTMQMRRCHAGCGVHHPMKHIQGFTRSHWMPPWDKFWCHFAAAAAVVDDFGRKHKTLTNDHF
jgi:hypothetical protein